MGRQILRPGLVLIVAALIVMGCSSHALPDDPLQAIVTINRNAAAVRSAHFRGDVIWIEDGGAENTMMVTEGDFEIRDASGQTVNWQMAVTTFLDNGQAMTMETVELNGENWARIFEGEWHQVPQEVSPPVDSFAVPTVAFQYLQRAKDVRRLDDENLNGIDCLHYVFTIEEVINSEGGVSGISDVWADKEHLFPRRQVIRSVAISKDLVLKSKMIWNYSKINEPIEIRAPQN